MKLRLLVVAALLLAGCGTSGANKRQNTSEVVGKPPGPEDDPFFYAARPPPEAKAATSGTIGESGSESATAGEKEVEKPQEAVDTSQDPAQEPSKTPSAESEPGDETKGSAAKLEERERELEMAEGSARELRRKLQVAREAREDAEGRAVELRAENLELQAQLKKKAQELASTQAKVPQTSDLAQCHSCVRICPLKGQCADDAELICGWGTGKDRNDAMLRATAECDGALRALSDGGPYSRVEGKCPVATCSRR